MPKLQHEGNEYWWKGTQIIMRGSEQPHHVKVQRYGAYATYVHHKNGMLRLA